MLLFKHAANTHTLPNDHILSLIVPAYKQGDSIVENVQHFISTLELLPYRFEILVVVDGMTDRTFSKLKKANLPHVTCLAYPENQGKAHAVRLGMRYARGQYIMFIDSGFEIDPEGIAMLLLHMQWYEADVIVGSKRHPASIVNYTFIRKLLSFGYYYLVRLLFGVKVTDTQAGIKIFKKEVLDDILPQLVEKRFAGDLEMLVVARKKGYHRIFEAPIKLNYEFSAVTSAATLGSIINILTDTLSIYYRLAFNNHYDQEVLPFQKPDKLWVHTHK